GAILGVFLAWRGLSFLAARLPENSFPAESVIKMNVPVLLFSVALAFVTAILFGLWPALQLSRPEIARLMQSGTRRVMGSVRTRPHLGSCRKYARWDARGNQSEHGAAVLAQRRCHRPPNQDTGTKRPAAVYACCCRMRRLVANYRHRCRRARRRAAKSDQASSLCPLYDT